MSAWAQTPERRSRNTLGEPEAEEHGDPGAEQDECAGDDVQGRSEQHRLASPDTVRPGPDDELTDGGTDHHERDRQLAGGVRDAHLLRYLRQRRQVHVDRDGEDRRHRSEQPDQPRARPRRHDPWSLPRPLAGCKTSRVGRLGLRLPLDLRPGLGLRPGLAGAVADGLVDDDGCRLTRDRLDQGRVHDLLHTGDLDRLVGALGG